MCQGGTKRWTSGWLIWKMAEICKDTGGVWFRRLDMGIIFSNKCYEYQNHLYYYFIHKM